MACAQLSGHEDKFVRDIAEEICSADRERDDAMIVLEARISTALAQIKTLRAAAKRKEAQIKELQRTIFGQSSEKRSGQQVSSESSSEAAEHDHVYGSTTSNANRDNGSASTDKKPRGMKGRQKVSHPSHLRRETVVIEPAPEQFCSCGCGTYQMGEQIIQKLAYKPAETYVIEERYPKHVCRNCNGFVQARVPERVFDYTGFDDSLTIAILVAKYADFLPLFRLEQIFGRSGVRINRSTLWRMAERAGQVLQPIYEALIADLKSGSKLFMDETTIPMQLAGLGKTKTCFAWAMCRDDRRWRGNLPPAIAFKFASSRAGHHAETFLENFTGILQVDGYAGYNRLTVSEREGGPVTLAYCWAHVRRKFFAAWKGAGSTEAEGIVQTIDRLFEIERQLKGQPPRARQVERGRLSAPIIDELFRDMRILQGRILKKSSLSEAINYTMKLREGLRVFLKDGRVEIDNNPVENTIRPLALLRKNALFAGSEFGGEVWMMMASLIGTCKLNGVEPYSYFKWVFDKIAAKLPLSEYPKLLPWLCPAGRYAEASETPRAK